MVLYPSPSEVREREGQGGRPLRSSEKGTTPLRASTIFTLSVKPSKLGILAKPAEFPTAGDSWKLPRCGDFHSLGRLKRFHWGLATHDPQGLFLV